MATRNINTLTIEDQILEAAEGILRRKIERIGKISEPSDAGSYLRAHCGHSEREVFKCLHSSRRENSLGGCEKANSQIHCQDDNITARGESEHPMTTKSAKNRGVVAKQANESLNKLFLGSLEKADQVQKVTAPLKPGVTHVVIEGPDGEVLVRRRFSAI